MREYYPCIKSSIEDHIVGCSLDDIIHSNFCKHRNTTGKYINEICLCESKSKNGVCGKHGIKELKKCKGFNKRGKPCGRNVRKSALFCNYCIGKLTKKYNTSLNIYDIKFYNFTGSGELVKRMNLKDYIYSRFFQKIFDTYNINEKILIFILKIFNMLSEKDQIHSTSKISLFDLNDINCIKLMQYLGYNSINDGRRTRFKTSIFNIVITNEIMFFDNVSRYGNIGAINLYKFITNKNITNVINDLKYVYNTVENIKVENKDKKANVLNVKKVYEKNNLPVPKEIPENINFVKKYLCNFRKLNEEIVDNLIASEKIAADKYKNCIFYTHNKKGAYLRGTDINCRFFQVTGDADFVIYEFGNGPLFIFESPIDCMSYYQMYKSRGVYASTNGATLVNIYKIQNLILKYSKYKIIYLCFDNDKTGNNFAIKIMENIKSKFIRIKPTNKDFNEDLIKK